VHVTGVIEGIELHTIPSKVLGEQPRPVARLTVAIERAVLEDGGEVDQRNLIGLAFEGAAQLVDQFEAGNRVAIETTTPSGMHIARITAAPLS
jgi:hypothetical protein